MTQKHFRAAAKLLRIKRKGFESEFGEKAFEEMVETFSTFFLDSNPRFSYDLFRGAVFSGE